MRKPNRHDGLGRKSLAKFAEGVTVPESRSVYRPRDVTRPWPWEKKFRATGEDSYWARFWWEPIRRFWATCTTCLETLSGACALRLPTEVILEAVIKGDTVREVLDTSSSNSEALVTLLRRDVEVPLREGAGYEGESGQLLSFTKEGLHGYPYLRRTRAGIP